MSEWRIYSIQEHDASNLHYDLRLEKDGVLKSWVIPKTPSKNPSEKRLAIQVDDHAIDHAFFEGEIEEGKYGAGTVELWDRGKYQSINWGEDKIIIDIDGEKLRGKYVLIRFKTEGNPENWLLFKKKE